MPIRALGETRTRDDRRSPFFAMPIFKADRACAAVVVERSPGPGRAGLDSPLFCQEGTVMLFADAKQALHNLTPALGAV
jgi:NAD(P) transhydrogenase subunit beta